MTTSTTTWVLTCQHPHCCTCGHISSKSDLLGPKDPLTIKDSFTCLSSGLIYCISCRRCPAIYIGKTGVLWGNALVNTSEASTRLHLVFPSQSILVLMDTPLRTRWSAGSNSARVKDRGSDRRCVSSFVSGHVSCAASMLIFSSFEVRVRVHNATFKF